MRYSGYTMINLLLFLGLTVLITGAGCSRKKAHFSHCEEGLHLLPMYGGLDKCPDQQEADQMFLAMCDSAYDSREIAAKDFLRLAWGYLLRYDHDNAMRFFNQAWLLDNKNVEVYCGFALLMESCGDYDDAIAMYKKALLYSPDNSTILFSIGKMYGDLFHETHQMVCVDSMNYYFKRSIKIEPTWETQVNREIKRIVFR